MKHEAINCPACGAKIGAHRKRCPRCRAFIVPVDPAAVSARNQKLSRIAAALGAAFVCIMTVVWITRPSGSAQASSPPPLDPSLSRPAQAAAAPPEAAAAPAAQLERAFLDPAASATMAYAAGDMQAALANFQQAVERNPNDAESHSNLGQVLVRLNRPADAIRHFERAIALNPDRWAYQFNHARARGAVGQWEESVAAYRRAQQLFPGDYVTAFNLALALRKQGNHEGALEQFQKAISLEPNDGTFRIALGMTLEALKLSPQAPDAEAVRGRIAKLRGTPAPPAAPGADSAASANPAPAAAPQGGPGR